MSEPLSERPEATKSPLAPLIAGVVLLVGAGLMSFGMFSSGGEAAARGPGGPGGPGGGPGPSGAVPVRVAKVEGGELLKERRVPGELAAADRATLRARVTGQVLRLHHELGEAVEAGAALVTLDPGTLPAELARAEAQTLAAKARAERAKLVAEQARRDLDRREALKNDGAVSASELDQVRTTAAAADADARLADAELARAAAEEQALRVRLADTRVRAPFAGRVAALHVDVGSTVSQGELVVELVSAGPLLVRFSVPEGDASVLAPGQRVSVRLPGGEAEAEVVRVGAALDPVSRSLPVEGRLVAGADAPASVVLPSGDTPDESEAPERRRLLPGMFVEVLLTTEAPKDAAVVPLGALVGKGARRTAFVVEGDSKARAVEVRVLLDDGERAAVAGLEPGARVVVAGADLLKDGQALEAVQ